MRAIGFLGSPYPVIQIWHARVLHLSEKYVCLSWILITSKFDVPTSVLMSVLIPALKLRYQKVKI